MGLFSLSLFTSKKKVANHSLLPIRVRPEIIPAQCQLQLDGHGRPTTAPTVPPISTCEAARVGSKVDAAGPVCGALTILKPTTGLLERDLSVRSRRGHSR